MRVPKGKPVHENLNTSYVNVGALLADLQATGFTGYVEVVMNGSEAYVFVDGGAIIGAIEQTDTDSRSGPDAINALLVQSQKPGGRVSIYKHAPNTTSALAGIVDSEAIHRDLSSEFTDLDKLVGKLRRDRDAVWYVEVVVAEDRGVGVIFIEGGDPDGVYSPEDGAMVTGAAAIAAMTEASESFGAVFDVYAAPVAAGAPLGGEAVEESAPIVTAPLEPPSEAPVPYAPAPALDVDADALAPLVILMSEVVGAIEQVVTARDGTGSFAIELRAGQLEVAEAYPFLDPFAAEFEYHAGEIAFVGNVDPEEFAVGLGEELHVTVSALARRDGNEGERLRQRIAEALGQLYDARRSEFDAFGLAGLITYIAEPEAPRETEARLGESA